jgi:hypothetical protein
MHVRERAHMRHLILGVAALVALVGVWAWLDRGAGPSVPAEPRSATSVADAGASGQSHQLKAETKRQRGIFGLGSGRDVRISTAETVDGKACLIEEDGIGEAGSCMEGGLFALRKVEFLVSSQGGPERFTELHVAGVAASAVRGVSVLKTDGESVRLAVNEDRAFVYESSPSDLAARVYPIALRLYGSNGKLVDEVSFPPAG